MVMKYQNKSFTLPAGGVDISQEEWDAVFHPEKCHPVGALPHKTPLLLDDIEQQDFNEDLPELPEWEDDGGIIHDEQLSQQNPLSQADGYASEEEETRCYIDELIGLYGGD